jgi:hypothetical protein
MAYRNVSAVTTWLDGGENRYPGRIVNVYVRPSAETFGMAVATSGRSRSPSGGGASG